MVGPNWVFTNFKNYVQIFVFRRYSNFGELYIQYIHVYIFAFNFFLNLFNDFTSSFTLQIQKRKIKNDLEIKCNKILGGRHGLIGWAGLRQPVNLLIVALLKNYKLKYVYVYSLSAI